MKSLNEWKSVNLTFQEKVTLLQNRINNISLVHSKLNPENAVYQTCVSSYNQGTDLSNVKKFTKEIDEIWSEIKSDLLSLKKE